VSPRRLSTAAFALLIALTAPTPQTRAQEQDGLSRLVTSLETALGTGGTDTLETVVPEPSNGGNDILDFTPLMTGPRSSAVIRERDRTVADDGQTATLLLDAFLERGREGQLTTWGATATRGPHGWRFKTLRRLTSVDGLYRLTLADRQYDVRNLTLRATDLVLRMREGTAFVAEAAGGPTALVLRGRGELVFTPPNAAEQAQLRIFAGSPTLTSEFREALVRLHPSELNARIGEGALTPKEADARERRHAEAFFAETVHRTYSLDLQDLSRERWSLVPSAGDLLAEIRTRKHGDLTYALSSGESEDVNLFQRSTRRNISVYASPAKLERRGPYYSEDDLVDYDILDHDINVRITPGREWIDGTAHVRLRIRTLSTSSLTLRLAEPLVVRSVTSKDHGRLMHLRVVNQSNLIVTLPRPVEMGDIVELTVDYGGRLPAQMPDPEAVAVTADQDFDPITIPPESRWIYSNRTYWYPQSLVTDFATARLRITVPEPYDVVATGVRTGDPVAAAPIPPDGAAARTFTFEAALPSRYLSCLITRLQTVAEQPVGAPGVVPHTLRVVASPRQAARAESTATRAADIFGYYQSLLGAAPYPELTVAVTESELPGGHSPAYFVIVNQPQPRTRLTWRSDPVSFSNYPSFFLAHEIGHQWWGQAIGWKNYHEQWISEGFTQYFAALYAGHEHGPKTLERMLQQMRKWAIDKGDEGPVYLGYRLGHLENDSRVFRALVYNKSAIVLHMLRRLVGDERFFAGMRRFYEGVRFEKAGTEDFRRVMEAETGRNLERFFERWIYGFGVPEVRVRHRVERDPGGGTVVVLEAEQNGPIYDLPVTVAIELDSGTVREVVLPIDDAKVELRVPVEGDVRKVRVDSDETALARFIR